MAYRCNHRLSETCETCTAEDWRAWRDDNRSERPAVTCEGCGTHYPRRKPGYRECNLYRIFPENLWRVLQTQRVKARVGSRGVENPSTH